MSPATSWTEITGNASNWTEGFPVDLDDCFCIFGGIVIPVSGGYVLIDPNTSWTEITGSAAAYTEFSGSDPGWTEITL